MSGFADLLLGGPNVQSAMSLEQALLSLLVAFLLGQLVSWMYIKTHSGLSYSRAFAQSIILITLIVTLGMIIIGNNLTIAVGLIGALAVIRFRNILKDTRDTSFIFFSLIVGMACGTGQVVYALLGAAVFSLVVLYLFWTAFGSRHLGDGFVRFEIAAGAAELGGIQPVFHRYCRAARLISQRYSKSGGGEIAYRLTLRDSGRVHEMVAELQGIEGVSNVTFVVQEEQAEV